MQGTGRGMAGLLQGGCLREMAGDSGSWGHTLQGRLRLPCSHSMGFWVQGSSCKNNEGVMPYRGAGLQGALPPCQGPGGLGGAENGCTRWVMGRPSAEEGEAGAVDTGH